MKINMSKISKKSKMIAATAFVLGITAAGTGVTYAAATVATKKGDHMDNLINTIAQKFNLNSSDVESVIKDIIEEDHKNMEARHEQNLITRLAQGLIDGKLTQSQVDLITSKESEDKIFLKNLIGKTKDERRSTIKSNTESLRVWAADNNIPEEYILFGGLGHKNKKFDHAKNDNTTQK